MNEYMRKNVLCRLKNVFKVLVFMAGVIGMVCYLSTLLERKSANNKYAQFFDEENNFDVLFLGTSHVVDAVYPLELWNDYGIVSYNFGGHGNQMPTNYWVLVNAMDYTTPELVVVDCTCLSSNAKTSEVSIEQTHVAMDAFPITLNKIKAVNDLFENPKDKASFVWDFLTYHDRWSELAGNDFSPVENQLKGAEYHIRVSVPSKFEKVPREQKSRDDTIGVEYLKKIIEFCEERGIEVLLTYVPFPALEFKQEEANLAYDIAEQYGLNYINFLDMDVVDYATDCLDPGSHLNPSGGRKVTDYLGHYIVSNYHIQDRRQEERYKQWQEEYRKGTAYKFDKIRELEDLDAYLCMLADKNVNSCIYIRSGSPILRDERMALLLKNISSQIQMSKINGDRGYFLLVDHAGQGLIECTDGSLQNIETSFGRVNYTCDAGIRELYVNNQEENYLLQLDSGADEPDVQIVTVDGITGKIEHNCKFVYDINSGFVKAVLWE